MTSRWLSGVGLHTGIRTRARYAPAATGAGLLVRRVDVGVEIAVACASVAQASRCTCLEQDGQRVETVEHALAALVGLGIHDAVLEVDGPEVPILDGSALPFVRAAREAGLPTCSPRLRITAPTLHEERGGSLRLDPAEAIEVTSTIDFPHPAVSRSTCVDDIRVLSADAGLCRLLDRELPSADTLLSFLHGFHDERLIEAARSRRAPGELAYIPEENDALRGLERVQTALVRAVAAQGKVYECDARPRRDDPREPQA